MNTTDNKFNNFFSFILFCKDNKFLFIPINTDSEIDSFKKGGLIKIKEKNKGSFTRYCGGNVTNECIRRGKNSPNPKIRKKATFAANARKWKHLNGGVFATYNINELSNIFNKLINNV